MPPESSTQLLHKDIITQAGQFQDSPLGWIPRDWDIVTLGAICRPQQWPTISTSELTAFGFPAFGANGKIGHFHKFNHEGPTVAITCRGATCGTIHVTPPNCYITGNAMALDDLKTGTIRLNFLAEFLRKRGLADCITGSAQPQIIRLSLLGIWVPCPPKSEQDFITVVLGTGTETIAKTEAVIAKLNQVRAGLLHDLLTRGIDEHGQLRDPIAHPEQFQDSPLDRIPREWAVGSLDGTVSQPSDLTIGPFGSNLLASDYSPEGTPVVFVRDVRENGFVWNSSIYVSQDKADELRAHCVFAGDVLITKMGLPPCIAAVYPDTMPSGVITADVIRLRPCVDVATSFWLAAYINSPRFAACVRQITGGVTRPKVTLADFRKQPVLLPSVEEQKHIEGMVTAMARSIEEVEAELRKLLMLKSGFMADLLTGRVRVPEEVAAAS